MRGRPGLPLGLTLLAMLAGGASCRNAAGFGRRAAAGEAVVARRPVEDVFLLSGELAAVRSVSIVAPRGDALQIRWMTARTSRRATA